MGADFFVTLLMGDARRRLNFKAGEQAIEDLRHRPLKEWPVELLDYAGIDPESGEVTDVVNASPAGELYPGNPHAVMNGIAAMPSEGDFLLTGKGWRWIRRVRLRPDRDRAAYEQLFTGWLR